jgi:hypothetical protein
MKNFKHTKHLMPGLLSLIVLLISPALHADGNYFALGVGDSSNYELWLMPQGTLFSLHKTFTDFAGAGIGKYSGRDTMYVGFVYGVSYYGIFVPLRFGFTYQHYDDRGWRPGVLVQLGYVFGRINHENWTAGIALPI